MTTQVVASRPRSGRAGVSRWLISAAVAAAIGGTYALPSFAAEEETTEELAEVTVTGSRIVRRDLTASSPIVTVEADTFDNTSNVSVEATLNELPQFRPDRNQFVAGDVQASAFNTPGISAVNLRGLGSNRNLVLLDGRRAQPANATMTVDVNSIPSAAIENVEIISGGASAVYGADAIAGVVNFKLKRNFQGLVLDVQSGITEQGDGEETRITGLIGGNLGDGRGNIMVGLEYSNREGILQADRDFYVRGWDDPGTPAGLGNLTSFSNYQPTASLPPAAFFNNTPSQAAIDAIFGTAGGQVARNSKFFINTDGTVFTQTGGGRNYNSNVEGVKLQTNGTLTQPERFGQLSSPLERYSIFSRGLFNITDNVSAVLQGNLTSFKVDQLRSYSISQDFWSVMVPRDAGHPVPTQLAALLDSRATTVPGLTGPTADWQLERALDYLGPAGSSNRNTVYQVLAGLEGKLGLGDWTWDTSYSHGETSTMSYLNTGFVSQQRYSDIIRAPNYGKNFTKRDPTADVGHILGYEYTCTTGLPVFENFTPSQDCIDAITVRLKNLSEFKQDVFEANLQGGLLDLPAGQLRAAAGVSWRRNEALFDPDILSDRENVNDRTMGFFASNDTEGEISVKEVYGELLVPVLKGLPLVEELSLELGARYSDYSTEGGLFTWKSLANWKVNSYVSLRGGFQRANRAPNIAEAFAGLTSSVVGFPLADPCGNTTRATWGNVPGNPNRQQVQALCRALIGNSTSTFDTGPGGPDGYRSGPGGNLGYFPFELELRVGNPNLKSEKAETWTAGLVLRSPFESAALSGLTAALDWYSIKLNDAISPLSSVTAYENCFNAFGNSNPGYSIDDPGGYCSLIQRDPTNGYRVSVESAYYNQGTVRTSGLDTQINWRAQLADVGIESLPGSISAGLTLNYLFDYDTQNYPGGPFVKNAGTLGAGGQYRFRYNVNLGYNNGGWGFGFNWRHLPSARSGTYATNPTTTIQGADTYDIVDFNARWDVSQRVSLRMGIDNLFDRDPEIVGRDPGVTNALGSTLPGYYDVLGRRFYAGVKLNF
jgi:outer membrane receptor protein involved in Fe transport